jgi:metallophosphoesterase superfamily enzyme
MAARTLIIGHNHPTIALEDSLGSVSKEPCWLRFKFKGGNGRYLELPEEVIMMPAFNRSLGGSPINLEKGKLLGPLLGPEMVDIGKARVYLPDGIYLGRVESLIIKGGSRVRTLPKPRDYVY